MYHIHKNGEWAKVSIECPLLIFFLKNIYFFKVTKIAPSQERALQVARRVHPARRQPALL